MLTRIPVLLTNRWKGETVLKRSLICVFTHGGQTLRTPVNHLFMTQSVRAEVYLLKFRPVSPFEANQPRGRRTILSGQSKSGVKDLKVGCVFVDERGRHRGRLKEGRAGTVWLSKVEGEACSKPNSFWARFGESAVLRCERKWLLRRLQNKRRMLGLCRLDVIWVKIRA